MRCLVTGGAGFIGSNLVDALVARGDAVTVVDDFSRGTDTNLAGALEAGATCARADVRDARALAEVFERVRPEQVFHLAAQVSVRHSVADPAGDAAVNVLGTANVLEAARRVGARRFVNVSTGGPIYGEGAPQPTVESYPPAPRSPYGQSKLAAEGYCELYRRVHGLSTVSLRYSNVYGPRQDPMGEAGVVAIFSGLISRGGTATLYGDGRQRRDFVFVGDAVRAQLLAASADVGGAINVSTATSTSILELIETLEGASGRALPIEHAPERAGELRSTALDPGRAAAELGWRAEVDLREGLRLTLGLSS